jgi:hypothetical protein
MQGHFSVHFHSFSWHFCGTLLLLSLLVRPRRTGCRVAAIYALGAVPVVPLVVGGRVAVALGWERGEREAAAERMVAVGVRDEAHVAVVDDETGVVLPGGGITVDEVAQSLAALVQVGADHHDT